VLREEIIWNRPEFWHSEIPGACGIASAAAMARFYGCLAMGGRLDGVQLMDAGTLELGLRVRSDRLDPLQGDYPHVFAAGFQLQNSLGIYGPPADSFGHNGAGGSVHCAWPAERVGISYLMNQMRNDQLRDPRSLAPLQALYDCVH
jgi:CubicO group peptidase (beta-lactamase class C family)